MSQLDVSKTNMLRAPVTMSQFDEYRCRVIELFGFAPEKNSISEFAVIIHYNRLMRVRLLQGVDGPHLVTRNYRLVEDDSTDGRLTHRYRSALGLVVQALGGPEYGVIEMEFVMKVGYVNTMRLDVDQSLNNRVSMGMDSGYEGSILALEVALRDFRPVE